MTKFSEGGATACPDGGVPGGVDASVLMGSCAAYVVVGDGGRVTAQLDEPILDEGAVEWLARSCPVEGSSLSRLTLVGLGRADVVVGVESSVRRDCRSVAFVGSVRLKCVESVLRASAAARVRAFRRWASATPGGGAIRLIRAATGSDVVELGMDKWARFNRTTASA